ncbi:hypothetical protein SDC9_188701 [bioreactor metagenome]|uniref:Uncharacterized protein n=1 Tax=bioreactor metagenome TaxID=1076179 RepID=A0A645HSG5_9ZZZZ
MVAIQYENRIIVKACILHILEEFSQGLVGIMDGIEVTVNRFIAGIQSEGVVHLVFREREVVGNGYELRIEWLRQLFQVLSRFLEEQFILQTVLH